MNRITEIELGGSVYPLNFSTRAACLFDERYDGIEKAVPSLFVADIKKLLPELWWMLSVLIDQGAEYRRIIDRVENTPRLTEAELSVVIGYQDASDVKIKMLEVMTKGAAQTIETESDPKNAGATQGE